MSHPVPVLSIIIFQKDRLPGSFILPYQVPLFLHLLCSVVDNIRDSRQARLTLAWDHYTFHQIFIVTNAKFGYGNSVHYIHQADTEMPYEVIVIIL